MPWASKAQQRWGNSIGVKALGGKAKVAEWNNSTDYSKLPKRAPGRNGSIQKLAGGK